MMSHVRRVDRGEFLENCRLIEESQAEAAAACNRAKEAEEHLSRVQQELASRDRLLATLIGAAATGAA